WTWQACWFLVRRGAAPDEVERCLSLPPQPSSAAEHLSADLTFRFLAQVHGRARAICADDVLTRRLEELLRRWPLSGVLADLGGAPLVPVEFDPPGLCLLYAERLAERSRPGWMLDGAGREHVELVFAERGLTVGGNLRE